MEPDDLTSFFPPPGMTTVFITFDIGLKRVDEMNEWLANNCSGDYFREIGRIDGDDRGIGMLFHFTEPESAFFFKMMFG